MRFLILGVLIRSRIPALLVAVALLVSVSILISLIVEASWLESTSAPLAEAKLSKTCCASSSLPLAISQGKDSGIHLRTETYNVATLIRVKQTYQTFLGSVTVHFSKIYSRPRKKNFKKVLSLNNSAKEIYDSQLVVAASVANSEREKKSYEKPLGPG